MRMLHELINEKEPAIRMIREWVDSAEVACDLIPPSCDRDDVLLSLQVTTRSPLGAVAYETGGIIIQNGWLRIVGSGHPRLPRRIDQWNAGRSDGLYLVADDAAGGFFALNGGALGTDRGQVYYWAPDDLDWLDLEMGYTEFLQFCLTERTNDFYEDLRWPSWEADSAALSGDRCFSFYPFLWTKEGSVTGSHRSTIPVSEAYDLKVDIVRQLSSGVA
jgi:Protein of unknown function DUF2625